ncbi:MAG: hypothetical protein OXN94_17270 [Chloroflexota bacterium]|nr:hypothetical protein [Chloroflexota bacterium]
MAITVRWKDQERICIETRFDDPWTLDDFIEARKQWHRMIKSVDYRVPIFLDMSGTFQPPKGILRQFSAIHRAPHPRQSHIFVYGLNPEYMKLRDHIIEGVVDPAKSVKFVDSAEFPV